VTDMWGMFHGGCPIEEVNKPVFRK